MCYNEAMKEDLAKIRHARSTKDFPEVDLEDGEWVELAIRRSKLGLMLIWAGEIVGFVVLTVILILSLIHGALFGLNAAAMGYFYLIIFILYGVLVLSGVAGTYLYKSNLLIVTNKRAIQKGRPNLLAVSMNIIDLKSVEDVSFNKAGLFASLFNIGTIRMSTVGDETTYTFPYVDTPRNELKVISALVHKVKEETNSSI